jgi:hypothetical protein
MSGLTYSTFSTSCKVLLSIAKASNLSTLSNVTIVLHAAAKTGPRDGAVLKMFVATRLYWFASTLAI